MKIIITLREKVQTGNSFATTLYVEGYEIVQNGYMVKWWSENGKGLIPIRNISGISETKDNTTH